MSAPVVVTAVFRPLPGQFDRVVDALRPAIAEVHAEAGCLLYALNAAPDNSLVMIEKWDSAELLDAHGAGEPVARLNRALDGLLSEPVVVTRLEPIPAGSDLQGEV